MKFGKLVGESFGYAKEGLVGKWAKWILLIISCIIFPLMMGYVMRVYRGVKPSPELNEWGSMFIDGIKLFIIEIIYAIPIIILAVAVFVSSGVGFIETISTPNPDPNAVMDLVGAVLFGLIILVIVTIIIELIALIGQVRFARTNSFGQAFNFGAIAATIGKIGIGRYIVGLIILAIIVGIIEIICWAIPYIGVIITLILSPFLVIFSARYITMLYESAGEDASTPA
ncbi:MAG: DUF4013 domain-containing protein [Methanomicrobiales archaeon]|nr:DUF4013 domain-containing protein [Methanomicrobiales archaeon]